MVVIVHAGHVTVHSIVGLRTVVARYVVGCRYPQLSLLLLDMERASVIAQDPGIMALTS